MVHNTAKVDKRYRTEALMGISMSLWCACVLNYGYNMYTGVVAVLLEIFALCLIIVISRDSRAVKV